MDAGLNALLLVSGVTAATAFAKKLVGPAISAWRDGAGVQLLSLAIAVGGTFLVRDTVWAGEQVVGGQVLANLDTPSTLVAGVLVGLGANVLDRTLKVGASFGENNDDPPAG